jgi:hypothetical protein
MVSALLNGTLDAFICMAVHFVTSFFRDEDSMALLRK